ncbi:amidohydrolase family protein [Burkholderia sp. AU45388]|nr:amidohydrolase family protein [Burkholderia sp. AU45388]MDN7425726.1 amidohydrolase family protein [Burkholderia sp. AU45388]
MPALRPARGRRHFSRFHGRRNPSARRPGGAARRTSRNRMRGIATFNWPRAAASDIVAGFPANGRAAPAAVPSPVRAGVAPRPPTFEAMTERLFINARDAGGQPVNLVVRDGRFAAIGAACTAASGAQTIDLDGRVVLPGFVDGHIHLDKSFVGDRWVPHEPVGSLRERLAVEKHQLADAPPAVEHRAIARSRRCNGCATRACTCSRATTTSATRGGRTATATCCSAR